jgi:predicted DCC family thiol-disulfide oxidoreductase YuxK
LKHSWTGGQYSVWRALLGLSLAPPLIGALDGWTFRLPVAALCFALAAGVRDRISALVLAAAWSVAHHGDLPWGSPGQWAVSALLLLHATTHGSPYGTLDARGRSDPGGSWILPRWNFGARRLLLTVAAGASLARMQIELPWALGVLLVVSAVDPGWIPPLSERGPTRVFYDGGCGLCHRLVRFLLAEDRTGLSFRFAPLSGATFAAALTLEERARCPDSVVAQSGQGKDLVRSRAILHLLARLGGLWRATGALAKLVPTPLLDRLYDGVARVRYRLFARPVSACPIVPAHLSRRFDP